MNIIKSKARNAVSRDKFRFQDGELDLDLTYITDRVIAMGLPGTSVDTLWRNDENDVARFFSKYHEGHFMIFNLSGEMYSYHKFDGRVQDYGFPDHSAPPLALLFQLTQAMKNFLDEHSDNVVAVHCLAGRGRTGTVISAFLLKLGLVSSAQEALQYFAEARSSKGEGVLTPSQIRYVHYYAEIVTGRGPPPFDKDKGLGLALGTAPPAPRLLLDRVQVVPCPTVPGEGGSLGGWAPVVQVLRLIGGSVEEDSALIYTTDTQQGPCYDHLVTHTVDLDVGCPVEGDLQLRFLHRAKNRLAYGKMLKSGGLTKVERVSVSRKFPLVTLFRASFHTAFISTDEKGDLTLTVAKPELDRMFSGQAHTHMLPDSLRICMSFRQLEHTRPTPLRTTSLPSALPTPPVGVDSTAPSAPISAPVALPSNYPPAYLQQARPEPLYSRPRLYPWLSTSDPALPNHSSSLPMPSSMPPFGEFYPPHPPATVLPPMMSPVAFPAPDPALVPQPLYPFTTAGPALLHNPPIVVFPGPTSNPYAPVQFPSS